MVGSEGACGSLILVGCGKMGGAMLEGWMALGLEPDHIAVWPGQINTDQEEPPRY